MPLDAMITTSTEVPSAPRSSRRKEDDPILGGQGWVTFFCDEAGLPQMAHAPIASLHNGQHEGNWTASAPQREWKACTWPAQLLSGAPRRLDGALRRMMTS